MDNTAKDNQNETDENLTNDNAQPELSPELSPIEQELADVKQKYEQTLRAYAESENRAKRAEKEKNDAVKYAASKFARDLLDVADTLQKTIAAINDDLKNAHKDFVEGTEITAKAFQQVFTRHDIHIIDPKGEKFDPNFHEAIAQIPMPSVEVGHIIDVVQAGYKMGDRLLRPARVVVCAAAS